MLVLHYGGFPCDFESVRTFAEERDLIVIEVPRTPPARAGAGNLAARSGASGASASSPTRTSRRRRRNHRQMTMTRREAAPTEIARYDHTHLGGHRGHAASYDVVPNASTIDSTRCARRSDFTSWVSPERKRQAKQDRAALPEAGRSKRHIDALRSARQGQTRRTISLWPLPACRRDDARAALAERRKTSVH